MQRAVLLICWLPLLNHCNAVNPGKFFFNFPFNVIHANETVPNSLPHENRRRIVSQPGKHYYTLCVSNSSARRLFIAATVNPHFRAFVREAFIYFFALNRRIKHFLCDAFIDRAVISDGSPFRFVRTP